MAEGWAVSPSGIPPRNMSASEEEMAMTSPHLIMLIAAFVPLSFSIVVGNLLVMATVCREDRLHTPTNFILASLACADFLTGAVTIPCELYTDAKTDTMDCYMTTFLLAPSYFLSGVSLMHQIIVTLDRVVAVYSPLRYHELVTKPRVAMTLVSVWLGGTFPACAFLYVWMTSLADDIHHANGRCGGGAYFSTASITKFELSLAVLVLIGLFLLSIFNVCIWRAATRQANQIEVQFRAMNADQKRKKLGNLQATKTVLGIVGTFIVSWTPVTIYFAVSSLINKMFAYEQLLIINQACFYFICINSAINPVIYGWKNKEFRKGLMRLFRNRRCSCVRELQQKPKVGDTANETSIII